MPASRAGRRESIRRGQDGGSRAPLRPRGWNVAVAISAAVFVLVVLLVGIGWLASRRSRVVAYAPPGPTSQLSLRLGTADVVIVGGGAPSVQVRRTDHYSFGQPVRESRSYGGGTLTVTSGCPRILVGNCSAAYEVAVPETVAVDVRTTSGDVRLEGFRGSATIHTGSGRVDAEAYCGFDLSASSATGDLHVATACSPQNLQLHTGSGDAVALVPPGRYRISTSGSQRRITGVTNDPNAPFSLDVHSGSGTATVGGGL
jgi:hypothetical protein